MGSLKELSKCHVAAAFAMQRYLLGRARANGDRLVFVLVPNVFDSHSISLGYRLYVSYLELEADSMKNSSHPT